MIGKPIRKIIGISEIRKQRASMQKESIAQSVDRKEKRVTYVLILYNPAESCSSTYHKLLCFETPTPPPPTQKKKIINTSKKFFLLV
jgi:hypothetical protein